MTSAAGPLARLVTRAGARNREPVERCDLCEAPVADGHRHLLDEQRDELMCVCQPCTLLFERDAAARGHYQLVPDRRVRLDLEVSPSSLGVPVGLAFFVHQADGTVVARYPSPMGTTLADVEPATWAALVREEPRVAELRPRVEALLIDTTRGHRRHWIVPVDDCYRLVAAIRREWRGLSGGSTVWPAVEQFFTGLSERAGGRVSVGPVTGQEARWRSA